MLSFDILPSLSIIKRAVDWLFENFRQWRRSRGRVIIYCWTRNGVVKREFFFWYIFVQGVLFLDIYFFLLNGVLSFIDQRAMGWLNVIIFFGYIFVNQGACYFLDMFLLFEDVLLRGRVVFYCGTCDGMVKREFFVLDTFFCIRGRVIFGYIFFIRGRVIIYFGTCDRMVKREFVFCGYIAVERLVPRGCWHVYWCIYVSIYMYIYICIF